MRHAMLAKKESTPAAVAKCPSGGLRIAEPNDAFEREADRVANEISGTGNTRLNWSLSKANIGAPLQRKCACESSGGGECEECKPKALQRRVSGSAGPGMAPPIVHEVLRSPGQPLDKQTREYFEPRFGHDFSKVRIHANGHAAESAHAVNALAYTVGRDVVFSQGQFSPMTIHGRQLLAHELTHVVQQQATKGLGLSVLPASRVVTRVTNRDAHAGIVRRAPIHTGRILDEGTCADLVAKSAYVCCDPEKGQERKGKTTDIEGTSCPGQKFTPIFTCDNKCSKALKKPCSDSDNWMTLPKSRFKNRKCGEDLVICANGKSTHGYVRDHSDKESWEAGRAIPAALGVKPDILNAAIYGNEKDAEFKKDKRCGVAAASTTKESTSSGSEVGATEYMAGGNFVPSM